MIPSAAQNATLGEGFLLTPGVVVTKLSDGLERS
jgi:hypothetical protein